MTPYRNISVWWKIAAVAGLVHASFSAYWAFGGSWLVSTVGQRAVDLQDSAPIKAGAILLVVAALKVTLAILPLTQWFARRLQRRAWRAPLWIVAGGLVIYGTVYSATAILVVTGIVDPAGGYERPGMLGHAFLWDPIFAVWGVALGFGLLTFRRRARAAAQADDRVSRASADVTPM